MARFGVYFYIVVDARNSVEAEDQAVLEAHERLCVDNISEIELISGEEDDMEIEETP